MARRRRFGEAPASDRLVADLRAHSHPLRSPADLGPLLDRIGDARVVMLGEASHGTHEFYTWRAELSKRLIQEKGFGFISVEGDWPDCYRVNRYIKGYPRTPANARDALATYRRWPTWMWANEEIVELAGWLRQYNDGRREEERVGFYGLDVYSLWDSLAEVMKYLRAKMPDSLETARRAIRCFEPYGEDEQEYARATLFVPTSCQEEVCRLLSELRSRVPKEGGDGRDGHFVAEQNALVVKNAEAYYRAMVRGDNESWNVRDRHMAETLDRLLKHHGPNSRAIVWEHNTHIGDARFTDMASDGMVNIGQLGRERYGEANVVLVGFGTYRGSVIAGEEWGATPETMRVPPGREDSWEDLMHRIEPADKLFLFNESASEEILEVRGHRAIGVVYRPQYEHFGNYVPTVMPGRYDAFLFIDRTRALEPLVEAEQHVIEEEVPETYPSGV
jgi:erythromycin esterase-like protein